MLYLSLVASGILLVVSNLAVVGTRHGPLVTILCAVGLVVCPLGIGLVLPTVALQALLLCVALLALRLPRGRLAYVAASLLLTATAYGITGYPAWQQQQEIARLRDRFPFESIEGRLPVRRAIPGEERPADAARWAQLESELAFEYDWPREGRADALRQLHEDSVRLFVNSPGFGVARMRYRVSEEYLTSGLRDDTPVPQPGSPVGPGWEADDRKGSLDLAALGIEKLHDDGVIDFLHPKGFGYVKDRRHVAGFQSHRFSQVPGGAPGWAVGRLELVGLVVHERPVVYVSDNLPRMDELRGAPTRGPDAFEGAGLEALRRGGDFFVRQGADDVRLLGSLRSVTQCVGCHGGQRGDLLGAFSYLLRQK